MGAKGPLAIVTPAEFRERTSLAMSSRSGTTAAVDKAYDNYVRRLMDSSAWGEHRARYWLDAARYADTHGFEVACRRPQ